MASSLLSSCRVFPNKAAASLAAAALRGRCSPPGPSVSLRTAALFDLVHRRGLAGNTGTGDVPSLLEELRTLDTACLCDADVRIKKSTPSSDKHFWREYGDGLRLLDSTIRPLNDSPYIMAGIARTVQLTQRNDVLAVLRGIVESVSSEVLVVHSLQSDRAVAGELFAAEAQRKGLTGIVVVDGPMRDSQALLGLTGVRCYACGVTPSAGTSQSPGRLQEVIGGGGRGVVEVNPGDVVVGDADGIVVGKVAAFRHCLDVARNIQITEGEMVSSMLSGERDLASFSNFHDHVTRRLEKKESNLEFRLSSPPSNKGN